MDVMIARGQADIGTFPREQLPKLARTGEIKPTDIYWHDGMGDWKPLSELLEPSAWEKPDDNAVVDVSPAAAKEAAPAPLANAGKQSALHRANAAWRALDGRRKRAVIACVALLGILFLGFLLLGGTPNRSNLRGQKR
jgi:hypothetical protein